VIDKSERAALWTIGNFSSNKVISFRVGPTENNPNKPPAAYGCGEGGADATCEMPEVGGELELPGGVYLISTSNVN
jgi:hypothetical protein